jgi:hypothetical protein
MFDFTKVRNDIEKALLEGDWNERWLHKHKNWECS